VRPEAGPSRLWLYGAGGAVVAAANVTVATGPYIHFLSPLLGLVAAVVLPVYFLFTILGRWWPWRESGERAVVAVAATLLLLIVTELVIDLVGPHLGLARPLDTWPVLGAGDAIDLILGVAAFPLIPRRLGRMAPVGGRPWLVVGGAAAAVPLAAMGAVRLDNGAGAGLTAVAVGLSMVVLFGLFRWRDGVPSWMVALAIYCLALALLFMTSLRGWYTTGHDVQQEMQVFLATAARGRWIVVNHSGYNGCLSITILPTTLLRWTRVTDPYVFKVFFQSLYAIVPVTTYYVARRFSSEGVAILSCVYFVGFVGFVQDMPMLNRQEIAFIFFFAALLVLLSTEHKRWHRWGGFAVLSVGTTLSHYSTTYFGIGMLGLALVLRPIVERVVVPLLGRLAPGHEPAPTGPASSAVRGLAWPPLAFLVAAAVIWNVPVNHTGSQLTTTFSSAVHALTGKGGPRAGEASLSIIRVGRGSTPAQAFDDLAQKARQFRDKNPKDFIASPPPSRALTPLVAPEKLPVTTLGRLAGGSARGASLVNRVWRDTTAGGLQVLLAIGLVSALLVRRQRGRYFGGDALLLGLACVLLLALQLALPVISLDYGVGRSFMQCLLILGPFVVLGTMTLAAGPLRRWQSGLALGVALAFFASTTGLVPQLLGAYGPQLHLNNSGDYYDRFYLHTSEVAAVHWLDASVISPSPTYPDIQTDFDFNNKVRSLGGIRAFTDIYPSDIQKNAYVVLGYTNVVDDKFVTNLDGQELWLRYPLPLLDAQKNLVYDNGTTRIYR
jgi:uncharacterized membrane protein